MMVANLLYIAHLGVESVVIATPPPPRRCRNATIKAAYLQKPPSRTHFLWCCIRTSKSWEWAQRTGSACDLTNHRLHHTVSA